MNRITVMAVAAALLGTSSCATLLQGTTEQITVISDPPAATVMLGNGETRVAPFTMTVPRGQDLQFHFSKPGCISTDTADYSQVEGGYLAADFFTLIGPPIDAASGAYYSHQQSTVIGHLDCRGTVASDTPSNVGASSPRGTSSSSTANKNTGR